MSAVTLEAIAADPHPTLAALRESEPVAWLPDVEGWIVTRRDLCIDVLTDAQTFTVDDERFSTSQVVGPSMLSLDGPEHRRHRAPFAPSTRERPVRRLLAEWTKEKANALVDGVAPEGEGDLKAVVAAPLSAMVMSHVLGLEDVESGVLLEWNDRITSAIDEVTLGRGVPQSGEHAFAELRGAIARSLVGGGMLTEVRDRGELSFDEIAANVAVMLIGGIVTSDGTISTALYHLLNTSGVLDAVRREPSIIGQAVEESMRMEPAAAFVDRYATRGVEFGGASIAQGDLVRVSISAANRDPRTFTDPDRFDISRPNPRDHIAFARGPHACLGIHVARLETRLAIKAIVKGLPGLRSSPEQSSPPSGLIFRSPSHVRAVWGGDREAVS